MPLSCCGQLLLFLYFCILLITEDTNVDTALLLWLLRSSNSQPSLSALPCPRANLSPDRLGCA